MSQRIAVMDVPISYAYIFAEPKKHPLRAKMIQYSHPAQTLQQFV